MLEHEHIPRTRFGLRHNSDRRGFSHGAPGARAERSVVPVICERVSLQTVLTPDDALLQACGEASSVHTSVVNEKRKGAHRQH